MDHVMMGYQVKINDELQHGSCDDTEYGGGVTIDKFLYSKRQRNLAVFVVRRYGGLHLGFDRFQVIEKTAAQAVKLLRPPSPTNAD